MSYQELAQAARGHIGPVCKACLVCDGRACSNHIPGPGAKGAGRVAIQNYEAWQDLHLNMDLIHPQVEPSCELELFGSTYALPVFVGPIGDVLRHYGDAYTMDEYNDCVLRGAAAAHTLAFTGDGAADELVTNACRAIAALGGKGIPTIKPWDLATCKRKFQEAIASGAPAIAMDIDAAGLPFLKGHIPPAGAKTVSELKEIVSLSKLPFIVKGIMTPDTAHKAIEAGASALVVSNHGGRVLDGTPPTAHVLPAIVDAVAGRAKIFVDGGIRSGTDVFRALALGADACLICRSFAVAAYGGGEKGVCSYLNQIRSELIDTMSMCGAATLSDISRSMLYEYSYGAQKLL